MSRGHFHHSSHFGRRAIGRCGREAFHEKVVIIDVDKGKEDVVIIDDTENHEENRCSSENGNNSNIREVIDIDDEDKIESIPGSVFHKKTSNIPQTASTSHNLGKRNNCKRVKSRKQPEDGPSRNWDGQHIPSNRFFFESDTSESSSESENSDCEIIEDFSGSIRKQWERASSYRRKRVHCVKFGQEDQASTSELTSNSGFTLHENSKSVYAEDYLDLGDKSSKNSKGKDVECEPSTSINGKKTFSSKTSSEKLVEDPLVGTNQKIFDSNSDPSTSTRNVTNLSQHEQPGFGKHSFAAGISDEFSSSFNGIGALFTGMPNGRKLGDDAGKHVEEAGPDRLGTIPEFRFQTNFQHAEESSATKQSEILDLNILPGIVHSSVEKENCDREQSLHHTTSLSQDCSADSVAQMKEMPFTEHIYQQRNQSLDELKATSGTYCSSHKEEATNSDTKCCGLQIKSDFTGHTENQENAGGDDDTLKVQNIYAGDREKHKESDDYKRAEEEEWASRLRILQIQSEEAQKLRKKRKAETLRLLDMERRQQKRLIEVRESQKKDEEISNIKEMLRDEVRKELDKIEGRYHDMASLLRALGIHVKGGYFPVSHEVNAAYKQALLRFHPDRASKTDIRQQVEAEETFKLISRLKEKLLPAV